MQVENASILTSKKAASNLERPSKVLSTLHYCLIKAWMHFMHIYYNIVIAICCMLSPNLIGRETYAVYTRYVVDEFLEATTVYSRTVYLAGLQQTSLDVHLCRFSFTFKAYI